MQCHVIAVGRPTSRAIRAPSNANGESTPACTWTTSGRRSANADRISRGPDGVHRQVERDPRAEPVDVHPVLQVDDSPALAADAQRGGQHVHLVPGGGLPRGEVTHLGLDPAGTRRVAVGDVDDQHGATVTA